MSEHVWAQENIAAYVAGGLEPADGERLENHVADCPVCARFVDEARALEKKLAPLVLAADPGPSLEDRIIQSLPAAQSDAKDEVTVPEIARRRSFWQRRGCCWPPWAPSVSALIEKHYLGIAGSPVRMAQAVDDERKVLPNLVGGTVALESHYESMLVKAMDAPRCLYLVRTIWPRNSVKKRWLH